MGPVRQAADFSNISQLANDLYTLYVYPFELAAVLLLTAIIAAITLVHRKESRSKRQNIAEQVNVQAADRVRLISASSSKSKESK
jgi:NADH-quinone oxidoreductase subunit J